METKLYVKTGLATAGGLILLGLLAYNTGLWQAQKAESPHYRADACTVCHVSSEGGQDLKAEELVLCTSCHEREGRVTVARNAEGYEISINLGLSHPWGLEPVRGIPATLPLKAGRITCQTCHDVHLTNHESHMLRLYTAGVGQDADFTVLCQDCHPTY